MNISFGSNHPSGLQTIFFTEMWERMSYYGMRALLELFMVDSVQNGGLLLLAFGKYRHQFGAFKETFRES